MEMKLARGIHGDTRINGLNLGAQLERVEIDWTGDGYTLYLVSQALTGASAYWLPSLVLT